MSHTFEEIIKQKLASQTYTSNDADWIKFQQKKQTFEHSKNIKRWLVGSGIAAIVIGTVVMVAVHHNPVQEPVSNSNSIFYDTLTPTISVVADTLQEVTSTPAQSQNAATDIKVQHKKLSTASTAKPQVQEIAKTSSKKVPLASTH